MTSLQCLFCKILANDSIHGVVMAFFLSKKISLLLVMSESVVLKIRNRAKI